MAGELTVSCCGHSSADALHALYDDISSSLSRTNLAIKVHHFLHRIYALQNPTK